MNQSLNEREKALSFSIVQKITACRELIKHINDSLGKPYNQRSLMMQSMSISDICQLLESSRTEIKILHLALGGLTHLSEFQIGQIINERV